MTVRIRSIDHEHEGHALRRERAWDDRVTEPVPGSVVVHDAMTSEQGFEEARAVALAAMGYAGFALDVYGAGSKGEKAARRSWCALTSFLEELFPAIPGERVGKRIGESEVS